ncbi:hypothetical protein ACEWY4_024987 [Coilia grayii]|uniref:C-type lectin domain-containing protein n=1 Tax=Coilia grayii TaxID=363190 RepID=A0ABD1IW94_9TELE
MYRLTENQYQKMSTNDVYSKVNLKAKKKTNSASAGDDDSDYIDYSLIDFTTSGNNRRRSKGAAQNSELSTQSAHTPVVFTAQSDFPVATAMTHVRDIKQSAKFLLCLNLLFVILAVILGILCIRSELQKAIANNQKLSNDKQIKDNELRKKQAELRQKDTRIGQLNQDNTRVRQELVDTKKSLDEQKQKNVLFSHIKKSIEVELKKYRNTRVKTGTETKDQEKILLDSVLQALQTGCAFSWKYASGKCFLFSSEKSTWNQSRDTCQAEGGHLAIVDTDDKWNLLKRNIPGDKTAFYWIGLTDLEQEGQWRWVNNDTAIDRLSSHWFKSEPDNWTKNSTRPEGEDCAKMNAGEGLWMDGFCDEQFLYICETTAAV